MKLFAYFIFFSVLHTAKLYSTLWWVNILNFDWNKFQDFRFVATFENQNKKVKLTKKIQ